MRSLYSYGGAEVFPVVTVKSYFYFVHVIANLCLLIFGWSPIAVFAADSCHQAFKSIPSDPYVQLAKRKGILKSEAETVRRVEQFALKKAKARDALEQWFVRISQTADSGDATVTDYAALAYLYRTGFFKGTRDREMALKETLFKVRESVTGETATEQNFASHLPMKYRRQLEAPLQLFYNASFREAPLERNGPHRRREVLGSYIPSLRTDIFSLVATLSLAGLAFHLTGAPYIAALLTGAALTSVSEFVFHRYGAHASEHIVDNRFLGPYIRSMQYNHTRIHHGITHRDYVKMFSSAEHHQKVDALILKQKGALFLKRMKENNYGVDLTLREHIGLVLPVIAITSTVSYLLGLDALQFALMTAPTLAYPIGVSWVHKYMHLPVDKVAEQLEEKPLTRFFIQSRYAALIARVHHVHHSHYDVNLNLLYLASDLVFGRIRLPMMEDLAELREEGGIGLDWGPDLFKTQ